MDYKLEQLRAEEDMWADADSFIAKQDFKNARVVMDNAGDLGYENLAVKINHAINTAMTPFDIIGETFSLIGI